MTFVDIRGLFSSVDASEGNWGIAHRRMTSNDSIFGVYGFCDLKNSSLDNKFSQITLGTELLGRDWGVRANGYIPINTSAAVPALNSALLQDDNIFVVDGQDGHITGSTSSMSVCFGSQTTAVKLRNRLHPSTWNCGAPWARIISIPML